MADPRHQLARGHPAGTTRTDPPRSPSPLAAQSEDSSIPAVGGSTPACQRSRVQPADTDVEVWDGQNGSVVIGPQALWVPVGRRRHREVPYAALARLGLTLNSDTLVLSTPDESFRLTADKLGGVHRLVSLHRSLVHRIAAHPDGDRIFAKLVRNERLDRTFMSRRPWASHAFIAVCVVVFAAQIAWQATLPTSMLWGNTDPVRSLDSLLMRLARIVAMGANSPGFVEAGEYFRLATANFLHAGWGHVGINLLGLLGLGPLVERIWGPWRLAAVFLLSGLTGAIASTWLTEPLVAVGVSTSLLGLLGAYFVVWLRFRSELPPRFAVPKNRWITLAVINLAIWWYVPSIDHWGHLGGAVGGAAFALFVHPPGVGRAGVFATRGAVHESGRRRLVWCVHRGRRVGRGRRG